MFGRASRPVARLQFVSPVNQLVHWGQKLARWLLSCDRQTFQDLFAQMIEAVVGSEKNFSRSSEK